jgi:hypothetical protein
MCRCSMVCFLVRTTIHVVLEAIGVTQKSETCIRYIPWILPYSARKREYLCAGLLSFDNRLLFTEASTKREEIQEVRVSYIHSSFRSFTLEVNS